MIAAMSCPHCENGWVVSRHTTSTGRSIETSVACRHCRDGHLHLTAFEAEQRAAMRALARKHGLSPETVPKMNDAGEIIDHQNTPE